MPLANYTTKVRFLKSVGEIQSMLGRSGAQAVMIDYENGEPSAVTFRIIKGNVQLGFRLPCDWRATLRVITADPKIARKLKTAEQAKRVAWRVLHDWLRAQMALIEIGAAAVEQVMLPYAITPTGETLYERLRLQEFSQLQIKAG